MRGSLSIIPTLERLEWFRWQLSTDSVEMRKESDSAPYLPSASLQIVTSSSRLLSAAPAGNSTECFPACVDQGFTS